MASEKDPRAKKPSDFVADAQRMLRRKDVEQLTGLPSTTLDRLEAQGLFVRRVKLAPRCVGWPQGQVREWIERRMAGEQ